jgi:hypothetical protein
MSETQQVELTKDDDAFFDAIGYLIDRMSQSRDERLAEVVDFAMKVAGKDPGLVTKLFVKYHAIQRPTSPEPYNPFARAYK